MGEKGKKSKGHKSHKKKASKGHKKKKTHNKKKSHKKGKKAKGGKKDVEMELLGELSSTLDAFSVIAGHKGPEGGWRGAAGGEVTQLTSVKSAKASKKATKKAKPEVSAFDIVEETHVVQPSKSPKPLFPSQVSVVEKATAKAAEMARVRVAALGGGMDEQLKAATKAAFQAAKRVAAEQALVKAKKTAAKTAVSVTADDSDAELLGDSPNAFAVVEPEGDASGDDSVAQLRGLLGNA